MKSLAFALIHMGDFTQAEAVIARLEARPPGALMAPELRMTLAQDALDTTGHAAVRRAYRQRFPEAARQSPPWLRHAGGEDGPEAPLYTPADLRDAADARRAHLALAYLELRLPHTEYLQLARQAVERLSDPLLAEGAGASPSQVQAAAALQDEYLHQLLFYMCSGPELTEARRRASAFAQRFPESSRARLLLSRAAVAVNDYDAVKALVADMGRGDLELWLAAADGDHERARAIWQRISRCHYHAAADARGLHLRRRSAEPPAGFLKPGRERILLFTAFRNERVFLPWFLDWYRSLGVDWFFIVDNLSTDGTDGYLAKQKDVTLFASRDNYAWAHAGMKWVNELIRRYGDSHWCVHVDSDEQLVPPPDGKGEEGSSQGAAGALRRCVDAMAERGEEALPAFMLDTYPESMAVAGDFRAGDDPLAASPLMDPDYFFFGKEGCCFFRARGGVRDRLFGFHSTMEKAPVLRGGGGRFYLSAHHTSYAKVSRTSGVLLHHKLLREALDLREGSGASARTDDRGTYCQVRHSHYRASPLLGKDGEIPRGPNAVAYESPAQLQRLGLIGDFASPHWFRGGGGRTHLA